MASRTPADRLLAAVTDGIVEPERAVYAPGAVRWWPYNLPQQITATSSNGESGTLVIETAIAQEVPVGSVEVARALVAANRPGRMSTVAAGLDGRVRVQLALRMSVAGGRLHEVRRLLAAQVGEARLVDRMPFLRAGGRQAWGNPPGGPGRSPVAAAVGALKDVVDDSWRRYSQVDQAWVDEMFVEDEPAPGGGVRRRWSVHPADGGRWAGHDTLAVLAWLEIDPTLGPVLRVRTSLPYAPPPIDAAALVRGLNADARQNVRLGLHGTWRAERDGLEVLTTLPLGTFGRAVVDGPEVIQRAVRRTVLTQSVQAVRASGVVVAKLAPVDGRDPWLTRWSAIGAGAGT